MSPQGLYCRHAPRIPAPDPPRPPRQFAFPTHAPPHHYETNPARFSNTPSSFIPPFHHRTPVALGPFNFNISPQPLARGMRAPKDPNHRWRWGAGASMGDGAGADGRGGDGGGLGVLGGGEGIAGRGGSLGNGARGEGEIDEGGNGGAGLRSSYVRNNVRLRRAKLVERAEQDQQRSLASEVTESEPSERGRAVSPLSLRTNGSSRLALVKYEAPRSGSRELRRKSAVNRRLSAGLEEQQTSP